MMGYLRKINIMVPFIVVAALVVVETILYYNSSSWIPKAPITEYPYSAEVKMGMVEDYPIYFREFSQENNVVTINEYAEIELWNNLRGYDIARSPLEITLTSDGKFIYTDRETGIVFNEVDEVNKATQ